MRLKLNLPELKSTQLGIDLGSLYTRICIRDKVVFHEPTCLLQDESSGSILSFGQDAYQLRDKLPAGVKLIFPIKQGQVADGAAALSFLKLVLAEVGLQSIQLWLGLAKGGLAVKSGASPLDRKLWSQLIRQTGVGGLKQKNNLVSIYDYWVRDGRVKEGASFLLMDIGDQTTDLGVVIDGQLSQAQTLEFGGQQFTEAIKSWLRQDYQLLISDHVAQSLKKSLPDLFSQKARKKGQEEQAGQEVADRLQRRTGDEGTIQGQRAGGGEKLKLNIRGVDLIDNLVLTKTVQIDRLSQKFDRQAEQLIKLVELALSESQTAGLVDAFDSGLYLTGGVSQLAGLADFLSIRLQTHTLVSNSAYFDTVKGLV
ncbi:MAG: hypothetical protein GF381_02645 [Candidatus Pacebacteria bacterium]|nr:hypothetical protein [Candidatus Paceibacterota bacterium]